MDVKTKSMGIISIDEDHVITLPDGLFGFEDFKKYALVDSQYEPLLLMQSLDEQGLCFFLIDPFLICNDYEVDADDKILEKIDLKEPSDVCVMAIVTVPAHGSHVTANLQGPLIINRKNRKGMQIVLPNDKYTTKYDILKALKSGGKAQC